MQINFRKTAKKQTSNKIISMSLAIQDMRIFLLKKNLKDIPCFYYIIEMNYELIQNFVDY